MSKFKNYPDPSKLDRTINADPVPKTIDGVNYRVWYRADGTEHRREPVDVEAAAPAAPADSEPENDGETKVDAPATDDATDDAPRRTKIGGVKKR